MIDELIQGDRILKQGIDILGQISSCIEIDGSKSSIFEVKLKDYSKFIIDKKDEEFFSQIQSQQLQNQNQSPTFSSSPNSTSPHSYIENDNHVFILKEIIGSSISKELSIVEQIRKCHHMIKGLVYLINYAVYETNTLEVGYILMEKGDMNLSQFIEYRYEEGIPITQHEYESILGQTISALYQMQDNKIAHHDIKPENIIVFKRPIQNPQIIEQQIQLPSEQQSLFKSLHQNSIKKQGLFDQNLPFSPNKSSKRNITNGSKSVKNGNQIIPNKFIFNEPDKTSSFMNDEIEIQVDTPQNNNIKYEIEIKICDIGNSQANQSTEKKAEYGGTLQYMSPEILMNTNTNINNYKQDVYSLGLCMVYLILQKNSNYHQLIKASKAGLISYDQSKGILEDMHEEWINIISKRMTKSNEFSKILTQMLCFDIKLRPDFEQLKKLHEELFESQQQQEDQSPQFILSHQTQSDELHSEIQLDPIVKNEQRKQNIKRGTKTELFGNKNFNTYSSLKSENSNKHSTSDSPNLRVQSQNQQNQLDDFNENNKINQLPQQILGLGSQSNESENASSPNDQIYQSDGSVFVQGRYSNPNSTNNQNQGISRRQQQMQKGSFIKKQITQGSVVTKPIDITLTNSISSSSFKQPQYQSVQSTPSSSSQQGNSSINQSQATSSSMNKSIKKQNPMLQSRKNLPSLNQFTGFSESIILNSDQNKQATQKILQNQEQKLPNSQSQQLFNQQYSQSVTEKRQILQSQTINPPSISQSLSIKSNSQKKFDIKQSFSTKSSLANQKNQKQVGFKVEESDQQSITPQKQSSQNQTKNSIDYPNRDSFNNIQPTSTTSISNQIGSLSSMASIQVRNPYQSSNNAFNTTLCKNNFASFSSIQQNNVNEQFIDKLNERKQKNISQPHLKLPQIQNNCQDSDKEKLQNGMEFNNFTDRSNNSKRLGSTSLNPSIKQTTFDSNNSNPSSPNLKQQRSSQNKEENSPQIKIQTQQGSSIQKSLFGKQKEHIRGSLSQTRLLNPIAVNNQQKNNSNNLLTSQSNFLNVSYNSFNLNSTNQLNQSVSRSAKSLAEYVNEGLEIVTVQDYNEIFKFYENFMKLTDKHLKYLTINLHTDDKIASHGMLDVLQKMDGLLYLSISFQKQKREVIDWALEVIQNTGQQLSNLQLIFKNCDYTQNKQPNNELNDFLRKTQINSEKDLYIIIKFEGKNTNPSEILEKLVDKTQQFQNKINMLSIDLKKNLDNVSRLIKSLSQLQKKKNFNNLGLDLQYNNLQQNVSNQIFTSLESLQFMHTLSINISFNPSLFDKSITLPLPHSLQYLYLNLTSSSLSSTALVKITKAIQSCPNLNTVFLYLYNSIPTTEKNQFMLFLPEIFNLVKQVGIFADSNEITDSEFSIYQSNLLEEFKLETLTLSLNKNKLTYQSFEIIANMIKMQEKLKKVTICFPRTLRKKQILEQFQNQEDREYLLTLKNDEFEFFTLQIDIIKKGLKKQNNLKIQTNKQSLTDIPIEDNLYTECWNLQKKKVIFQGYQCITCNEKEFFSTDCYICLHCIKQCHKDHKYIQITEFPSVQLSCKCKERGQICESYKQFDNIFPISPLGITNN